MQWQVRRRHVGAILCSDRTGAQDVGQTVLGEWLWMVRNGLKAVYIATRRGRAKGQDIHKPCCVLKLVI